MAKTILLLSTYDLGRQPFGLASPAAWLRAAGHEVHCVDLTRTKLRESLVRTASLVGFFLPMHTATRMALPVIARVRELNSSAHLCAYGLYAPLNEGVLRAHGIAAIFGPEFEQDLVALAEAADADLTACTADGAASVAAQPLEAAAERSFERSQHVEGGRLPRLRFIAPDRSDLPPLARYASLRTGTTSRIVGYTEATRGCKHLCRHCPIVPVYQGRFRIVPIEVVMADIDTQVHAGAQHITFGDPDFFNGPRHAMAIVEALAQRHPGVSYDVTIKVEHLRQHAALLPRLRETGCAFVTSAVESIDDEVLEKLQKGHTRADFEALVDACGRAGLTLSPTFVAFTPWTTMAGYCELVQAIDRLKLVNAVASVQYAIRLLIPQGSRMLELPDVRAAITHYDPRWLTCTWHHPDPRVDQLQRDVERLVGSRLDAPRAEMFDRVWTLAHEAAGIAPPPRQPLVSRAAIPYLNEPWYC